MSAALRAENLTLKRGGKRVLEEICAGFETGKVTAIVGPNGAGKSSLLLALAGLLEPEDGRVELAGRALSQIPHRARAKALGYLPQSGDIAWDVTARSLITLGRMPHGDATSPSGKAAIDAAISALDCEALHGARVHQLSGGERARVLLARVLAGEPHFILADEPLAALDLAHQISLITHFKSCAANGTGVVMVLHDLGLAMNHADRVLVLDSGKLIADAAPVEALSTQTIARVWGVKGEWIGKPGALAFAAAC